MKTLLFTLACFLFAKNLSAQSALLSFDEHNKYIYYQVTDVPGVSADSLLARGINFLKTNYPKIKTKPTGANSITGDGKIITYGGVSVLKHESGEIDYTLNIEFKDQKYRYWITGFTFTPYQKDRYGNFVPQLGMVIPLETAASKLDKKDVNAYLNQTGAFCKQFSDSIKLYVNQPPGAKKVEIPKKVVTDKW